MEKKSIGAGKQGPSDQPQRRVVVYPTQRSSSVVKTNATPKYIPCDPIRSTVPPVEKLQKAMACENPVNNSFALLNHEATIARTKPKSSGLHCHRDSSDDREAKILSLPVSGLPDQISSQRAVLPFHERQFVCDPTNTESVESYAAASLSISHLLQNVPLGVTGDRMPMVDSSMPLEQLVNIKKDAEKIFVDQETDTEMTRLREEIEVLTKVNSDLKKLLVASIGDDLHYKVDALVRTKVQLANEIGDYTRKLVEDYEDLDKLTIQADLWHSKYQASKVLVEQLTVECDRLNALYSQAEMALQYTIQERHELQELLILARNNLMELVKVHRPSVVENLQNKSGGHALDVAVDIKRLSDTSCRLLLGRLPQHPPETDTKQAFTPAELVTHQVLSSARAGGAGGVFGRPGPKSRTRHPPILLPRFHPGARYEGFILTCCTRCKGDVIVL